MAKLSLLGVPHDDNSSFLKGAAEAPAHIRRELQSDAYSIWSETGVDLGAPGVLTDHGDVRFDGGEDPWDLIERHVGRAMEPGVPLICLGGDHAITHPILRGPATPSEADHPAYRRARRHLPCLSRQPAVHASPLATRTMVMISGLVPVGRPRSQSPTWASTIRSAI